MHEVVFLKNVSAGCPAEPGFTPSVYETWRVDCSEQEPVSHMDSSSWLTQCITLLSALGSTVMRSIISA